MRNSCKCILAILSSAVLAIPAFSRQSTLSDAVALYESRLYASSMNILQNLPEFGNSPVVDGYYALCAQKLKADGSEAIVSDYLDRYSFSPICRELRLERAYNCFDRECWEEVLRDLSVLDPEDVPGAFPAEFYFKKGYCSWKTGDNDAALTAFSDVEKMPSNDYTAPARYYSGYILYSAGRYAEALPWFEKCSADERFSLLANFYSVSCTYAMKDYDGVIAKGVPLFENSLVPSDRMQKLARMLSESCLVAGDKEGAAKYYAKYDSSSDSARADLFYNGSLLFSFGKYKEAVNAYEKMTDKTDSIGQIALYQTALSYIRMGNKVAAEGNFKAASQMDFDKKMKEEAAFNYAKLAFDLRRDTRPFNEYMEKWSDKVRGEKIYSYMALAALSDRDYDAAITAYDKIDELKSAEKNNYVHANYLQGVKLFEQGDYSGAAKFFNTVSFFTPKNDRLNQLARYNMAESCYRNGRLEDAAVIFTELYNASALVGMPENELLAYNVAYSYYKQAKCNEAYKWFTVYASQNNCLQRRDALLRSADCLMVQKQYHEAAVKYKQVIEDYPLENNLYPRYKAAIACGLSDNRKERKEKLPLLKTVVEASPDSAYYSEALFELGKTQMDMGMKAEAKTTFALLAEKSKDVSFRARALLETGTVLRNSGDKEGALKAYKTVVETMPECGFVDDALLAIESIYQSQNRPEEYLAYLENVGKGASKTESDREEMFYNSAEQLYWSGNYASALDSFKQFKESFPSSDKLLKTDYYIAESAFQLKDYPKVIEASLEFEKHEKVAPEQLRHSRFLRANSYLLTDQRDKAMEILAELALQPDTKEGAQACYLVVKDAYDKGNFEEVAAKTKALAASGTIDSYNLARCFILLGDSYVQQGKEKQAKVTFQSILDGYGNAKDGIMDEVNARLEKLTPAEETTK